MSTPYITLIQQALSNKLKLIKTAAGYSTNLLDANVHIGWDNTFLDQGKTSNYPMAFIMSMGKRNQLNPGGQIWCIWTFSISLHVIKAQTTDDPELMIAQFEDDVKKVLISDIKLGGLVELMEYTDCILDSETCYPEGMAVLGVVAQGYDVIT